MKGKWELKISQETMKAILMGYFKGTILDGEIEKIDYLGYPTELVIVFKEREEKANG